MATGLENSRTSNSLKSKLAENKLLSATSAVQVSKRTRITNSLIHKAAGFLVTGRSLQNGKMSMGNRRTERPPDPVLYGGRPSGSFVNSAVNGAITHTDWLQQISCVENTTHLFIFLS